MFGDSEIRDSQVKTQSSNNRRFQVQDAPPTGMERPVPCDVRKESEMESAVHDLDAALDRNEKELCRLFERLSPILRPVIPLLGTPTQEELPLKSPLTEKLQSFDQRIRRFTCEIVNINDRLAL